jgi:hypothetical protein
MTHNVIVRRRNKNPQPCKCHRTEETVVICSCGWEMRVNWPTYGAEDIEVGWLLAKAHTTSKEKVR